MNRWPLALVAFLVLACNQAEASTATYTTRASFSAAVGATVTQDFNSYSSDVSFRTSPVDVGPFSLSATGSTTVGYDLIDESPDVGTSVDGSTDLRVRTDISPVTTIVFTFDTPITAFGADFRDLNNDAIRTQILAAGDNFVPPIRDNIGLSFFGISSTTPFSVVQFTPVTLDVYGIDNVSCASVPEPAMSVLVLTTCGGVGFCRRKRAATNVTAKK